MKGELYMARRTIVELMREEIARRLSDYYDCRSERDFYDRRQSALAFIIKKRSQFLRHLIGSQGVGALFATVGLVGLTKASSHSRKASAGIWTGLATSAHVPSHRPR